MSNFLQRIAATAAQTQVRPRLQPMSGSIFVPAVPLARVGAGLSETWVSHRETAAGRPEMESNSERIHQPHFSAAGGEHRTVSAAPDDRFALYGEPPLLHGNYGGEEPAQRRTERTGQAKGEGEEALSWRHDAGSAQGAATSGSDVGKPEPANSTESARLNPMRPAQAVASIPLQSVRSAAGQRVEQLRRAAAERSEPDEIHIHIGRIEVAAVAPPAPRVAAPAPRKSLNLDEYLRRGHGGGQR